MKRVIGLVVAALVVGLLALNWSAPAVARVQAAAVTPTLSGWTKCGSMECSTLTVPLNYAAPTNGQTVRLAISRLKAVPGAGAYAGIVVGNPGGPGASGLGMPFVRADVPGTAALRYDWIGFDPRGVGSSSPSLHCNPKYFGANRPNFVPTTTSKIRYWKKRTANYAKACGASKAKALLPYMTTRDSARDLESLRVALRAAEPDSQRRAKLDVLNYYGFSYGTYLGAVYATLYPTRVGRFVLDGVVDPARYWYRSNLDQSSAFDKNLNRFFAWVAKHDRTYHLGKKASTIRKGYNALLKKVDKKPAAGGKLGPDELADGLLAVAYDRSDWPGAAAAYSKIARKRQGYPMYARYKNSNVGYENENGYAVYLGVQCTDQDSPGWTQFAKDTKRVHKKRPYAAWNNTWYNMPCRTWPAPARGKVHVTGAAVTAKILLVNETYDAATPFSGALTLRSLFPTARLVEGVGGTTHSASLRGISCLDNRIAAYLNPDSGAVPARLSGRRADVRCSAYPKPSAGRVTAYRSPASTIR